MEELVSVDVLSVTCNIKMQSEGHLELCTGTSNTSILISLADLWMWMIAILPEVFISVILSYFRFLSRLNVSILAVSSYFLSVSYNSQSWISRRILFSQYCHVDVSD